MSLVSRSIGAAAAAVAGRADGAAAGGPERRRRAGGRTGGAARGHGAAHAAGAAQPVRAAPRRQVSVAGGAGLSYLGTQASDASPAFLDDMLQYDRPFCSMTGRVPAPLGNRRGTRLYELCTHPALAPRGQNNRSRATRGTKQWHLKLKSAMRSQIKQNN